MGRLPRCLSPYQKMIFGLGAVGSDVPDDHATKRLLGRRSGIGTASTCEPAKRNRVAPRAKCAPGRVAVRIVRLIRGSAR
jgi:hypothetical protein